MRRACLYAIVFGLTAAPFSSVAQEKAPEPAAKPVAKKKLTLAERKAIAPAVAEKWLALVDNGNYKASWNGLVPLLRRHYERKNWVRSMEVTLPPLGAVKSRNVRVVEHHTQLPGGPPRDYLIFRYDTEFENRKAAEETLTLMYLPLAAKWQIAGYFVK